MVSVNVSAAGKPIALARGLPMVVELSGKELEDVTIADVKNAIAKKYPKFQLDRQKITLKDSRNPLADDVTLKDAGVVEGGELSVKDLGAQVSWKTVFLVEYAGPMFIHPAIYYFPEIFYGGPVQHSMLQRYVLAFVMLHFAKRELETLFVHRFSHATMPFMNIFKNSAHYHLGSGLALAYSIYSPVYGATSPYIRGTVRNDPLYIQAGAAIWLFSEISNLITHINLRTLRPAGSRKRAIPQGYGFNLVSVPNYFFEFLGWLVIAALTGSYAAWFFVVLSTSQMYLWAIKKHRAYKKEFGSEYPRDRKAMFPFIA
ncbi:3-oxo-5-alpha-steroid 4-dehydrogenase-domain-containing protein [Suillus clintonianus]|uniref:3-oxo-5-alpha-steroid 4-dehydrogenase-domain-containing protein n=1 Tax=Suillus clintonianus TaxID=1904413 RepID=UPI001B8864DF|nr:3-oxo-5-alpha-steroid 4-dehydrogenase-domain-containing protein [Suillus clintonianus]KAG2132961.1 3-oxo-5-alpha-steroid 4-dehydrogenase-domain-containing protein [Suillus clintonianus]